MSTSTTRAVPTLPVSTGSKKILLVEDSDTTRLTHRIMITKRTSHTVVSVANGNEALKMAELEKPDLILMDIVMPDMDGVETLKRLRTDDECPNRLTPAIALTAKLSAEDLSTYAAAGFDGVAGKPINVRELAQAIAPFMVGAARSA